MNEYFQDILRSIESSLEEMDESAFDDLVDDSVKTLKNSNKIVTSGLGKNVPICDKFVGTMLSFGLNATFLHTNTAAHGDLGAVHDGDLVILLSKSGETAESIYLMEQLSHRHLTTWSLSFNANSSLVKMTDKSLVLSLDHEGDGWDVVPNNSTTLNLIVLQALAITLADKMDVSLEEFRRNHPGGYIGEQLRDKN